jgi:N-acetylneuraminic acid mutarotase
MVVWGGSANLFSLNTGGKYSPGTDSWTATSMNNVPTERGGHAAIWNGNEMIVWGGYPRDVTGGRYNPGTDTWTATSTTNAPPGRDYHTAVWTGSEMIVWGGEDDFANHLNTGGRYCAQFASPTPRPTPTPRARPTPAPRP